MLSLNFYSQLKSNFKNKYQQKGKGDWHCVHDTYRLSAAADCPMKIIECAGHKLSDVAKEVSASPTCLRVAYCRVKGQRTPSDAHAGAGA